MGKHYRSSRGSRQTKKPLDMREQARRWIEAKAQRGQTKASGARLRGDRTVTHYAGNLGRAAEAIQRTHGTSKLKDIDQDQAQAYIDVRAAEGLSPKTCQAYAQALQTLPSIEQLEAPSRSAADKPTNSRAYTDRQINEVQRYLPNRASLSAKIMRESGCRTKDLATIRLANERPLQAARLDQLHDDRFAGREDWINVTFIGKGGHEYESTISQGTATELRQYRLATPKTFTDRGKLKNHPIKQQYNIPAGKDFSDAWRQASERSLGFNHGAHGLRHTFAQVRVEELQQQGFTWTQALERTSEQIGHYRYEEIYTYLR